MMNDTVILRVAVKLLVPIILMFALYVQFHGDYGPGGGFQAGVAVATAIILYGLIFGLRAAQQVAPPAVVLTMIPLGVLIYGGTGVVCLLLGGEYLNYSVLAHDPEHGQHYGIMAVEIGVLLTVSSTMLTIFYAFAGRNAGTAGLGVDEDDSDSGPRPADRADGR
jgi:multicomponent Na+:H+ antiporter subunit B